jgi:glycosyltransferase involved in cell wall biosynthesis
MKVTICICTWNRSISLKRTLDSLVAMRKPVSIDWEVLIVNNNSNDDTDIVVDSFARRLPVRRVFESAQALSNARNAGVRAARGDYILWTDDDVIVGSDWLAAYCAAFDQTPSAAIFGGAVHPYFEEPVPNWLERGWSVVASAFAAIDFGQAKLAFSPEQLPFGANFATRRDEQKRYFFDPKLGPGPSGKYYAEETTVLLAMLADGATGCWVPNATVTHVIPQERMTLEYIKRYYERDGRTDYYLHSRLQVQRRRPLLARPPWVWRAVVESELRYWYSRAFQPAENWLFALRRRSRARGMFDESRNW